MRTALGMTITRFVLVPWFLLGLALARGFAQTPAPPPSASTPDDPTRLEIDDCPTPDAATPNAERRRRGAEHYSRGETLYLQGDYIGAVAELVASYCIIPYYSLLKDIGQAYERNLDYERAIAYLERYIAEIPPDAKRATPCAADPKEDKENVTRRVSVLRQLRAHILVQTEPPGAQITLVSSRRIENRARAGEDIAVPGGRYRMQIELPGYEAQSHDITVQIGRPYTYFHELRPLSGTISIHVVPSDARIFLDNRLVGIGRHDAKLDAGQYTVMAEAPGRVSRSETIEILPNQLRRVPLELSPTPQFGRRQLIAYASIGGIVATAGLLSSVDDSSVVGVASLAGGAAGLLGTTFLLGDDVLLGTSNLTITSSVMAGVSGLLASQALTDDSVLEGRVLGASLIAGAGVGYYFGKRMKISPGDAALINSSMVWGAAAGGWCVLSFEPSEGVSAGLVLSGVALGGISGVIMARHFDISRTRSLLIDVGGVVGILGGIALESLAYPDDTTVNEAQREHVANFALGGMAVGLIAAGILTRNFDAPRLRFQPVLGQATASDGSITTVYGLGGSF